MARSHNKHSRVADEQLMESVQDGDAGAFEALYDRHGGAAYSLAFRIVGTHAAAEDATQDAFISIWRSQKNYLPERGSVRNWILRIVRSRTIDSLRRSLVHDRRRASGEGVEETEPATERTDEEALRRDEARNIRTALEKLPEQQVRVIELAYFGGFTHVEIAEMLDTPLGTVKGRMRLGLDKLHTELAEDLA